jgi:DNA-directed RNA polymerase specialized sigma24 family protein
MSPAQPVQRLDRKAKEDLFREHHESVVRKLQRIGIPRVIAEDAASFAWLMLLQRDPNPETAVGWVHIVARHEAFALLKRSKREQPNDEICTLAGAAPNPGVARQALELTERLKPQQRLVLRLQMHGYSYEEMCEVTGQTYTWVNRHITEGRRALRQLLARDD